MHLPFLPHHLTDLSKCLAFGCLLSYTLWQYQSAYALLDVGTFYIIYKAEVHGFTHVRFVHFLLWLTYIAVMFIFFSTDVNSGIYSWQDFPCQHVGTANNSNLKIIVAALPKMGTTTMYHALSDLGLHTYHGEDMCFHYPLLSARPDHLNVAEYLSKCNVEAICLDQGYQHVSDIITASPDAKIFIMQWRTPEQWLESLKTWCVYQKTCQYIFFINAAAMCVPPWNIFFKVASGIITPDLIRLLHDGYPSLERMDNISPSVYLELMCWRSKFLFSKRAEGSAEVFNHWYQQVRSASHQHISIDIDPTLITYEELCLHLHIKDCPRHGKLERSVDFFRYHRRAPFRYSC